ncbi:HAD family hydrolase [Magnetospirillum sp. UT-4]|uniref:HAD family hydrolase n=1 Tax=Magnetospirillum sp. UT-4 TaxID=2681467 RepID=UPI00137DD346|nr:HAD family hydrolase [Magnetospirillum sp. UT-4]CAA7621742.1 putative HAD-superfamily hydrolase, subfamily IA, variant 1 [Magnetospirillum sp. UT-4]
MGGTCSVLCLDFDGVILESVDVKDQAYGRLFEGIGDDVRDRILVEHRSTPGVPRPEKVRRLYRLAFGRQAEDAEADRLVARYAGLVAAGMRASPPVPGFMALAQSCDLPLYVVTAAPEDEVRGIVAERGWSGMFRDVMGAPRAKSDLLRDVCRRENVAPADILFVGDRPNDHRAAVEVGAAFIGRVPSGAPSPFPADVTVVPDLTRLLGAR